MKDRVDNSMGIVTRITEALARIKPTDPLRLSKRETQGGRNETAQIPQVILRQNTSFTMRVQDRLPASGISDTISYHWHKLLNSKI